ncbi:hypothetical protein [Microseira sp. BLCC-F43]|uniref:hypothetical protein n=1 Tax=Microseira sp. BLCC-F43 TaxID=3153602 RepID=UPI0035B820F2
MKKCFELIAWLRQVGCACVRAICLPSALAFAPELVKKRSPSLKIRIQAAKIARFSHREPVTPDMGYAGR